NSIFAVYISSPKKPLFIEKIIIPFKGIKKSDSYIIFIFEKDKSGFPGKILLKKRIMHDSFWNKGIIVVEKDKIILPDDGIFIGISSFNSIEEDLEIEHTPFSILTTTEVKKNISYIFRRNKCFYNTDKLLIEHYLILTLGIK